MIRMRYSRRHALTVVLFVGALLTALFAVLYLASPSWAYAASLGRTALIGLLAAGVAVLLVNVIGEAVERSTHQRF